VHLNDGVIVRIVDDKLLGKTRGKLRWNEYALNIKSVLEIQ